MHAALKQGGGHITIHAAEDEAETAWRFGNRLHCAHCNIEYGTPLSSTFSFNSPLGACDTCRGSGASSASITGWWCPTKPKLCGKAPSNRGKPPATRNARSNWNRSEEHTSELQSLMRNSYA